MNPGRWTIVTAGVLVPALLCAAGGLLALWHSRALFEQRAELTSQNLAAAIERTVSTHIEKVDLALRSVVDELEYQQRSGRRDRGAVERHIASQLALRPELDGLRVTDARGIAVYGPGAGNGALVDLSDREWFRRQRDDPQAGLLMSKPLVSRFVGEWILSFSRRYQGTEGDFAGAVTASVKLSYLGEALKAVDVGPRGIVLLRHADLSLIARHRPGMLQKTAVGTRDVSREVRALIEAGRAQATLHTRAVTDATERTTSFRRSSVVPLIVIVGLGTEDYLADWYAEVRVVIIASLAVVGLCGAGTLLLLRSLAQSRAWQRRAALLTKVYESSSEAIVVMDRRRRIVEVNPAFLRRSRYELREVLGRHGSSLLSRRTARAQFAAIHRGLSAEGCWRGELLEIDREGREIPAWIAFSVVKNSRNQVTHIVAHSIELTSLKAAEEQIRHLAHHDTLTLLPNRVLLQARLEQALAMARRDSDQLAMLFIDMDRFKTINDTLGHLVGDALLVEVGQRLRGIVRESDIVARLGGDEFVLVLCGAGRDGAHAAAAVAHKVLAGLGAPYHVAGHVLHSTPSIGIGIFPVDGEDAEALMKSADTAMYQAKSAGRNNFQFFTAEMKQASAERLVLEGGLRTAIARGELRVHYQPQLAMADDRIVGMEALVRWQHPELAMIPPLKFIPVAEESGQIEAIGIWVLEESIRQIARWRREIDPTLRVAVNISVQQLRSDRFGAQVAALLERFGLPGSALELEVTESAAMHDTARTASLLRELRAYGVALAIDDFGTGYSSMAYLKQLPLSCLKLDRSFVMDIENDANDAAICRASIQLAHSLGLAVVAEGVETNQQLEFLRRLGCDIAQGYLVSKPLPAPNCERFLAARIAPVQSAHEIPPEAVAV